MTKAHILGNNSDYWSGMTETVQYYYDYIYDGATFSFWCKRSDVGTGKEMYIYDSASPLANQYVGWDSGYWASFGFDENDKFFMYAFNGNYYTHDHIITSMKFSDPNAWYHIHLYINAEESVASNRFKLTVNGQLITEYVPASRSDFVDSGTSMPIPGGFWDAPAISGDNYYQANYNIGIGGPSNILGRSYNSTTNNKEFKGILSHFYYDSKEHAASNFGEVDSTTGIWKFKPYSPTWSEHGFYILKDDNGFTDQSGKSPGYINTVTITGSVTDTLDCPSNVFATMNPLVATANTDRSFANGNTYVVLGGTARVPEYSTLGMTSGKYYAEVKDIGGSGGNSIAGISGQTYRANVTDYLGFDAYDYSYNSTTGDKGNSNSESSYGDTWTDGNIIGIALDLDNNKIYFSKNGVWQNSGDPTSGATGTGAAYTVTAPSSTSEGAYFFACGDNNQYAERRMAWNFGNGYFQTTAVSSAGTNASGNGIFEFDCPTGFTALSTKGLNL